MSESSSDRSISFDIERAIQDYHGLAKIYPDESVRFLSIHAVKNQLGQSAYELPVLATRPLAKEVQAAVLSGFPELQVEI